MAKDIEAIRNALDPLLKAIAHRDLGLDWTLPWKVKPCDGKPIIASNRGGNLFQGYIATWQEADLIVAVVNALPDILEAIATPSVPASVAESAADFAELRLLFNYTDDDRQQFTRWQMLTALAHGRRLAQGGRRWAGVIELVEQITGEEGASVTFVCANRDFNGLPNEAVTVMQGEDWQEATYRGDTLAACLQQAIEHKGAGQ